MHLRIRRCVAIAAGLAGARSLVAEVVTVGAARDNTLYQDGAGALSNGAGRYTFAGSNGNGEARRGLLWFDVAGAVPAGATITGASLTLHMSRTNTGSASVSLHRALAGWGEGASVAPEEQGTGAKAQPGDATWLHTFHAHSFWATPGGDFAGAESAAALVAGNGFYTWGSTAALLADAQSWLDAPASNFGWALVGDETTPTTAKRFDTRESPDPAVRPSLRIEFVTVPAPGALAITIGGGAIVGVRRRR